MFRDETFVLADSAKQAPDDDHSFSMAVQRVANPGVTEMKAGAYSAGIDLDAILCQRSSLQECAQVVGMAQLAVAFVFFALSVFAGHRVSKPTPFSTAQAAVSGRLFSLGCKECCATPFGTAPRTRRMVVREAR